MKERAYKAVDIFFQVKLCPGNITASVEEYGPPLPEGGIMRVEGYMIKVKALSDGGTYGIDFLVTDRYLISTGRIAELLDMSLCNGIRAARIRQCIR